MALTTCDVCGEDVLYRKRTRFTTTPELCQSCLDIAAIMALSECSPPPGGWPAGSYFADDSEEAA